MNKRKTQKTEWKNRIQILSDYNKVRAVSWIQRSGQKLSTWYSQRVTFYNQTVLFPISSSCWTFDYDLINSFKNHYFLVLFYFWNFFSNIHWIWFRSRCHEGNYWNSEWISNILSWILRKKSLKMIEMGKLSLKKNGYLLFSLLFTKIEQF